MAPSLPGYGFSHTPGQHRLDVDDMAALFTRLMTDALGYPRYAAEGGDWGAFITARLGSAFPREITRPPGEWAARVCNLKRWTDMPEGGHFAALEEPEALVEDIRAFFRELRKRGSPRLGVSFVASRRLRPS